MFMFLPLLVAIATATTSTWGAELSPFLPHMHGRTPQEAWGQLERSPHADTFIGNIGRYNGWSESYVRDVLENQHYTSCAYQGWFWSDGLRYADGTWSVGTIYRQAYPNERFACVKGKPIYSGTCGNAIKGTGGNPSLVCRDVGVEHGSITVGGAGAGAGTTFVGGTPTTTSFDNNLFECHITAREK